MNASKVRTFLTKLLNRPYVFVIDEFNRGNVPKIFGELITLIEADKCEGEAEGAAVHLVYDTPEAPAFSVPSYPWHDEHGRSKYRANRLRHATALRLRTNSYS